VLVTFNIPNKKMMGLEFNISELRTFNVVSGTPAVREVDGMTMLFVPGLYVTDKTLPGLFRYSVAERHVKLIARGYEPWTDWLVDDSGRIAAQFVYYEQKLAFLNKNNPPN
jgi:hypothetical protein